MKKIAYIIFLTLILSSCKGASLPVETPTPDICSAEDLTEFITTMGDAAQQFEHLAHAAEDTPGENLEPVIKEMQEVQQDVENIDTPPCALKTKAALDYYMFSKIQCHFQIYAVEVVEGTRLPVWERKIDSCSLASDQLEYYNTKMDELNVLLLEKN